MPCAGHVHQIGDARTYMIEKLAGHDLVFMGTTHKQPAVLNLMVSLAPRLRQAGVTHLALEISSDQQERLDEFLGTGNGLERIKLHAAIDCKAYRQLLVALQGLGHRRRPRIIAVDLPQSAYAGPVTRDEYMARALFAALQSAPDAKVLAMLGSLHVLRKLQWRSRIGNGRRAIRAYLSTWRPDLRLFSVVHLIGSGLESCDFSRRLSPLDGVIALDVDSCFKGWHLGITDCLALRSSQPYDLVDGVIVH